MLTSGNISVWAGQASNVQLAVGQCGACDRVAAYEIIRAMHLSIGVVTPVATTSAAARRRRTAHDDQFEYSQA